MIADWITDFSVFFIQFHVYFRSKVGKLKATHIMCKRDIESAKAVPESVLSNRGNLECTHLTRFSPGERLSLGGGLSPYTVSALLLRRSADQIDINKALFTTPIPRCVNSCR